MITAEVAVLYSDLSIVRVPWARKDQLRIDKVLAVALVHPDRPAKSKRYQGVMEYDWYLLTWTADECLLGGYDEDYYWFSLTEPWLTPRKSPLPFTVPADSILFEGVQVSAAVYEKAKLIYDDRSGGMF